MKALLGVVVGTLVVMGVLVLGHLYAKRHRVSLARGLLMAIGHLLLWASRGWCGGCLVELDPTVPTTDRGTDPDPEQGQEMVPKTSKFYYHYTT